MTGGGGGINYVRGNEDTSVCAREGRGRDQRKTMMTDKEGRGKKNPNQIQAVNVWPWTLADEAKSTGAGYFCQNWVVGDGRDIGPPAERGTAGDLLAGNSAVVTVSRPLVLPTASILRATSSKNALESKAPLCMC